MKKIFLLAMLAGTVQLASAKKVKFAVNMLNETVNITGVHVMGDFQTIAGFPNGNWQPGTTACIQENGGSVYSVVVDIPAHAKYEFIFVNGDQSYEVEFVPVPSRVGYNFNDNRWVYIDSTTNDTTLIGPLMFSGNAPHGLNLVRFRVDMQNETVGSNGVRVGGSFNAVNTDPLMYSFDGKVFEHIAYVVNGGYEYKYSNWNAEAIPVSCSSNGFRLLSIFSDSVLVPYCFGSCTVCTNTNRDELKGLDFGVYPNPFSQKAIIDFGSETSGIISMTDVTGREVLAQQISGKTSFEISRGQMRVGIYFLKISDVKGSAVRKLVIE